MAVFFGYTFIIMSVPLCISYLLYNYKPQLANASRLQKTILLTVTSFFALDLTGVLLGNFANYFWFAYCGGYISVQKALIIGITVPFYYLSTKYWDTKEIDKEKSTGFYGLQIFGLLIGVVIGFIMAKNGYYAGNIGVFSQLFLQGL